MWGDYSEKGVLRPVVWNIVQERGVRGTWLGTLIPFEEDELETLLDGLLWELSERGFEIVNRSKLRTVFSPTISSAREAYDENIEHHRVLIGTNFGESPDSAFVEPPDELDLPLIVARYKQIAKAELEITKKALVVASATQILVGA